MTAPERKSDPRMNAAWSPALLEGINLQTVERMVKDNLEMVIQIYLLHQPRTGRELMEQLRADTGVRLSPGRIYPLLHGLQKQGVLTAARGARQVVYRPANRAVTLEEVRGRLDACSRMTGFFLKLLRGNGG